MAANKDYYKILGVDRNADANAIKKHTENWQKSIIRIPIRRILLQMRNLKK